MRFVSLVLACLAAYGQSQQRPPGVSAQQQSIAAQQAAMQKMQASLEIQRASVSRQLELARQAPAGTATAPPASDEFFTVPWPDALPMPAAQEEDACPEIPQVQLSDYIQQAADREGLSPDLLRAVINKESSYRPCAVSPKGAMGLMQLMPGTADDLKVRNPFDAKENIDGGSRLLRSLLDRYSNNLSLALGAYNAGPGAVDRSGGVPAYPETQRYVTDILGKIGFQ
ncbi:MAG: lytic transglycosylase domain-containing protein [Acidobacteria bacterium]|nr:lytic transglycosylase domain-containing protein [Acidobacteriota bacterium]